MFLLALVVLLLVVRPLVRRILESEGAPSASNNGVAAIADGAIAEEIKAVPSQTSKMIDMAQVQGQVHALWVISVGELADGNPNETVSIIRSWLHEDAA
jgi:flagellar M-ring protein FliF